MSKNTEKYPIDVVVPWVDGSDVEWQKEKQRYLGEAHSKESASVGKYRNWDNFHLQIRSILVNMPWVNKVYIVTNGQIPKWYKKNDKVVIIRHDQFVPKKYLPVFGINPIEVNLHKIPGLSEHFVYLNDDIFVINKTKKTDFFKGGLPCDNAILNVSCVTEKNMIYQIANNNTSVINSHLDMKNCMNNNKKRWFSRKNGIKNNIQNLIQLPLSYINISVAVNVGFNTAQHCNSIANPRNHLKIVKMPWMGAILKRRTMIGCGKHYNTIVLSIVNTFHNG